MLGQRELFVSFTDFPWFAACVEISSVEWPSENHLYPHRLHIDLSVRSEEHPEEFSLKSGGRR